MAVILIVEDDADTVAMLSIVLRQMGYGVVASADGHDIDTLIARHHPALIMLDMRLPNARDGWSIAAHLRQCAGCTIPVLAISVPVQPDEVVRALAAGCSAYLAKPFSLAELRSCVMRLLASPPAAAAPR